MLGSWGFPISSRRIPTAKHEEKQRDSTINKLDTPSAGWWLIYPQITTMKIIMPFQVTRGCVLAHDHHCQKEFTQHFGRLLVPTHVVNLQNTFQTVTKSTKMQSTSDFDYCRQYMLLAGCMHQGNPGRQKVRVTIPLIPCQLIETLKVFRCVSVNFEKTFQAKVVVFQLETISPSATLAQRFFRMRRRGISSFWRRYAAGWTSSHLAPNPNVTRKKGPGATPSSWLI